MFTIKELIGSVKIPEQRIGDFSIEKFSITEKKSNFFNGMQCFKPEGNLFFVEPGDYTRLKRKGHILMSDTPLEARTNWHIIEETVGDVIIFGLGLGFILPPILDKPTVTSVTVVEISPEVIEMVAVHYEHPKLTIIEGDAHNWMPKNGRRFDFVYYDIWGNICGDLYNEMKKLTTQSRRFRKHSGVTRCWVKELVKDLSKGN